MTRVGVVVRDWKALRALPDNARVQAWGWPETAARVKASMRERLHLKISSKLSWYGVGRIVGSLHAPIARWPRVALAALRWRCKSLWRVLLGALPAGNE